jgi:hypothetical protein
MTPSEPDHTAVAAASALQKAYVRKRRAWAKHIGRPYSDEDLRPPPGELDIEEINE